MQTPVLRGLTESIRIHPTVFIFTLAGWVSTKDSCNKLLMQPPGMGFTIVMALMGILIKCIMQNNLRSGGGMSLLPYASHIFSFCCQGYPTAINNWQIRSFDIASCQFYLIILYQYCKKMHGDMHFGGQLSAVNHAKSAENSTLCPCLYNIHIF